MRMRTIFTLGLLLGTLLTGCMPLSIPLPTEAAVPGPAADEPLAAQPAADPATVVSQFYTWYLGTTGDPAGSDFRNPLVDRAYHQSDLLTESYKEQVDRRLEAMPNGPGGGYDPFLCAQDVPGDVVPEQVFQAGPNAGGTAHVLVSTDFPGHVFTVDLFPQADGSWRIGNVACGGTPAGQAKAFYTWYLGTIGDRAGGDFRNPLTNGAYRESPFLSQELVQEIDESLANMQGGGFDPFLHAQDIPTGFSVDPGVTESTARIDLLFGPDSMRVLEVTVERGKDGRLLIQAIQPAQPLD